MSGESPHLERRVASCRWQHRANFSQVSFALKSDQVWFGSEPCLRLSTYASQSRLTSTVLDRLLASLSAQDIEGFIACYDPNATIEDGDDRIFAGGHVEIRSRCGRIFKTVLALSVEAFGLWEVDPYFVQQELVTGRTAASERHIAVYQLARDLILRERLLR